MKIMFLTLRGNIIGDSVREIALAKKYTKEYQLKEKITYPCGSVIYELLQHNKYLKPIRIKEFDMLSKNASKIKKLTQLIKGYWKVWKITKNHELIVYLGSKYKIRKILAKTLAKKQKAKFKKDSFENAKGFEPELTFTKEEENKIKKIIPKKNNKLISINMESKEKAREWPIKNFNELINELSKENKIILLGTKKEYFQKLKLNHKTNIVNLIGKTTIRESVLIIKNSDFYIGNDSGLIHIAYSVKTQPIVIIEKKGSISEEKLLTTSSKILLYRPKIKDIIKELRKR